MALSLYNKMVIFFRYEKHKGKICFKTLQLSPGHVAQLVGALSHTPEGCRFNPWSGHVSRFHVQPLIGMCGGGH